MKGDVIFDHFFQKDSLGTVGFGTFRTFRGEGVRGSEIKIMDFGVTGLGIFPQFYQFF